MQVVEVHGPVVHPIGPLLGQPIPIHHAVLVLADLVELALLTDHVALALLQGGNGCLCCTLRVVHGEVSQLDAHGELVLLVVAGAGLDKADVMKDHLALVHRSLVEDLGGYVLGRQVDALAAGFFQHRREQAHFELEGQDVHP